MLTGKVVYVSPYFLREAPNLVSEELFDFLLNPRLRFWVMLSELYGGVKSFERVMEEVGEQMEFVHSHGSRRPFWPPFGLDWILQDLKRAVRRPVMGLAFWLRPRYASRKPRFLLGRKEEIFGTLAREGWIPAWTRALYGFVEDRYREHDEPPAWLEPSPFLPGEFVRLAERVAEYLAFLMDRLGLGDCYLELRRRREKATLIRRIIQERRELLERLAREEEN